MMICSRSDSSAEGSDAGVDSGRFAWLFLFIVFVFQLLVPGEALARSLSKSIFGRIDASALVTAEWSLGTDQGRSQKLESRFEPEINFDLPFNLSLTIIGRFRTYVVDRLVPSPPSQDEISKLSKRLLIGDQVDLELREFYVEGTLGRTFFTIGKQQIVWGKADGLKVLDAVNPQDFREFILAPFDVSRIPLWALNLEIPIGEVVAQLLWIPDPTYHELPESDAVFAFTSSMLLPKIPDDVPIDFRSPRRPRRLIADSDAGMRLSTFWAGWDLTLNYLYQYDNFPVFSRKLSLSSNGPLVTITPRYKRTHLLGGTFSNAFGDLTLRGEVGFFLDRPFMTNRLTSTDGVVRHDELTYVLGFDWYGIEETLVSLQFFQTWITQKQPGLLQDDLSNTLSLFLQREFLNDSLVVENIVIQNVDRGDGVVRPKVSYELRDNMKIWLGADVFYGTRSGLFGQFNQNDRVVVGIEWGI